MMGVTTAGQMGWGTHAARRSPLSCLTEPAALRQGARAGRICRSAAALTAICDDHEVDSELQHANVP